MADTGPRGPQGPAGTSIDLPVAIANGGTGATTAAEAADNILALSLLAGEEIPEGSDLNDYTTAGNYRVASASIAATVTNSPTTIGGYTLLVLKPYAKAADVASNVKQVVMTLAEVHRVYVRACNADLETWGPWYKFEGTQV